ncbi:hypothetical protein B0I72DRAFT_148134 [Yarrowia lipolytica]|uniref:Uncharacterized protein n=1 Tax=Yarrowia lipolytica TaxID=4952 RepID=A0A371C5D4_YARLL|nr:hypothetical protein B0I71DRAFT_153327 [Yarrowia lipolytica]RDW30932.1 hypothetical protein B0I72DRAFT_148134 [Yarrowia lipolytica]RDW40633.1 hypothetical protein B0I73DRAFT_152394 [Yarrowia lipolytica]RDW56043.1 hypothetical protein B0I75DRAFT_170957 [Yarrowia lipolytica]
MSLENEEALASLRSDMDTVVQNTLNPAIDTTAWKIRAIHESQVVLSTVLHGLSISLKHYQETTKDLVAVSSISAQIRDAEARLESVNKTLAVVESRLARINSMTAAV